MARTRADVGKAECLEQLANRALVIMHAEALLDHALEIHPAPAHDAVDGPIRTCLDKLSQLLLLGGGKPGLGTFDQMSLSPSGPCSLNPCTQSRSVWRSMPPIRAASVRFIPSRTAASDNKRRLWLAFLVPAARRRSSAAE